MSAKKVEKLFENWRSYLQEQITCPEGYQALIDANGGTGCIPIDITPHASQVDASDVPFDPESEGLNAEIFSQYAIEDYGQHENPLAEPSLIGAFANTPTDEEDALKRSQFAKQFAGSKGVDAFRDQDTRPLALRRIAAAAAKDRGEEPQWMTTAKNAGVKFSKSGRPIIPKGYRRLIKQGGEGAALAIAARDARREWNKENKGYYAKRSKTPVESKPPVWGSPKKPIKPMTPWQIQLAKMRAKEKNLPDHGFMNPKFTGRKANIGSDRHAYPGLDEGRKPSRKLKMKVKRLTKITE